LSRTVPLQSWTATYFNEAQSSGGCAPLRHEARTRLLRRARIRTQNLGRQSRLDCACAQKAERHGVRAFFFLVEVSSRVLAAVADLIAAGDLQTRVGDVLPLAEARIAHEMLAGKPHKRGKIVLAVDEAFRSNPTIV
jgi:NADPH:quinone reductase-like Zn-dependent oxidoreductase